MTDMTKQSTEDLKKSIAEKRVALRTFRFGGAGSRTRNVREGRNLRKEVARALTEIRKRETATNKKV
ncbi:50S ribosomal protein L29 [Candidatus Kaiserbacteria bacterium RIFCSPLOWO2_01_FULL_54_20]|uniref:Large ribosomal subunit protein uL29 n=1 Tax=Candidatus Kaiserbacteria bacterium RIFCSPLOWO2_01_FULL_54_20 TaxID=1798513 RepID=A0A1F6EKD9_9BACT|nr:MAG: 50S ribosomal protein L29 [Candidatus Kaiserbacteria bacterium RIFCSPLOWO2_01_FULL_54_20]